MKRKIAVAIFICALIAVCLVLIGGVSGPRPAKPGEWVEAAYTVRSGDTLWEIAGELGIQNRQKWSYEVCRMNDIPQGGLIYPGDTIIIYTIQNEKEN